MWFWSRYNHSNSRKFSKICMNCRTHCPDVHIPLKPRANGRDIVGCYMFYPFAHPIACSWEFFHKVLNWSNVELRENGRNNSQHYWELLGLFTSFSKFLALFYLLYLMPYWPDKHQTWGFFSVCTFWLWGPCVDNTRTCTESPQRTRMTLSNNCTAALFFLFCNFSIFQEELLKDFGYNWFLLNRFVFMGLSCSLDLTILENFRNKKQMWSLWWKRNERSLTLKWIRSV